ncbi:hypothetical protein TGPRC2_307830 [Toxoplasma gondii TgCatPRC2]|uniref:Uncharacterized protein n=1 Tax=Toxoplasma gondii TgCatPRC2 TaxID=1130821 RepID=A0A151GZR9_TOXGO|nr:hypothetical protein TGPRC2_307830 [Toxoplasma gondii TgCatPRC2]
MVEMYLPRCQGKMVSLGFRGIDELPEDVRLLKDAEKELENSIFHLERSNNELMEEDPNDSVYSEAIKENEVALEVKHTRLRHVQRKIAELMSHTQTGTCCCGHSVPAGSSAAVLPASASYPPVTSETLRDHAHSAFAMVGEQRPSVDYSMHEGVACMATEHAGEQEPPRLCDELRCVHTEADRGQVVSVSDHVNEDDDEQNGEQSISWHASDAAASIFL